MRALLIVTVLVLFGGCQTVMNSIPDLPDLPGGGGSGTGGGTAGPPAAGSADTDSPGEGIWANYDFVAGSRVLYFNDFEDTPVGNFPNRTTFIAGQVDVVEMGGNRVARIGAGTSESSVGGQGCFTITLPETLPEDFTLEFRYRTSDPLGRDEIQIFSDGSDDNPDTRCTYPPPMRIYAGTGEQGLKITNSQKSAGDGGFTPNQWADIALSCDGPYCKMYTSGTRVANLPQYDFPRARKLHVFMNVYRFGLFIDNIRIADGATRSVHDELLGDGLFETTAIRFDTASDRLRPESTGILNEIVAALRAEGSIRVRIEGHTDSDGSDASNQDLSERRASAVQRYLTRHGIDGGRLETVGFGESQPVAPNTTAEGKAQNRRVGFRRL